MNPIFFLPLLVLALWAIDRRILLRKINSRDAMLDRKAVLTLSPSDYNDPIAYAEDQALLGEYEEQRS